MSVLHPKFGELPLDFPVFPLVGALLLPHGKLPLNIFEPRYLAMVEDALAGQRMFGLIQPDAHQPEVENGPAMFGVGCLGRLSSFSETDDERFLISVTGLIRFDVKDELSLRRGYRRVVADFSRYQQDLEIPADPLPQRMRLMAALRAYFAANGFDANWDAIEGMADDELVVTLAMICPFDPVEKQALLEAVDPGARAATLLMLLEMGARGDPGLGLGRPLS
ncbi:MAG: LON peptidase substrate-binding domain-containing protein [Acetobacteraceae bacterium]